MSLKSGRLPVSSAAQINFIEIPLDYRDFFYFSWHSSKQQMSIFLADFRK
jgi:hypothetical protein